MGKLTLKQKIFVAAYVADPNATKAAKAAGYSAKSARNQASRMMRNVYIRERIDQLMKAKHEEIKLRGHRSGAPGC